MYTGVGYMQQDFEYVGDPIMQYSPSGMSGYDYRGNGTAGITYDTTYSMLYFLLGADVQMTQQFNLSGRFSVAPLASAEDELHHLLRNKVSTGDMDGTAYMFKVSGNYRFVPWCFMEVGFQHTNISVDGEQQQVMAGQALGRIDMEVVSEQSSGYITMGYSF
ncbi:MAG: omptin family outer membrane protease [Candidatus Electrothrix sp. AR4]|nr:omptin family outer membrane protease [Candidatus Electrothrix sp. AR4]